MKLPSVTIVIPLILLTGLVGCNLPAAPFDQLATTGLPEQYGTVAAILTATASVATATPPDAVDPTASPGPEMTDEPETATASPSVAVTATLQPSATSLCDLASAGVPIDVTIPDDTQMQPGESFVKVWRLVNAGACTWTQSYAVTWFSGDDLGVRHEEVFHSQVAPGNSVDLSIDMVAPEEPGVYQSNWKLRNGHGDLFGIGPGGGSPFWVRIQVVAVDTLTPTVIPPTLTPTPVVSSSGSGTLQIGEGIDVDTGELGTGEQADFILEGDVDQMLLSPFNDSRVTLAGADAPSLADCQASQLSAEPIQLGPELEGAFLCIQTSRGLPGSLQISVLNLTEAAVGLAYTVWSVP